MYAAVCADMFGYVRPLKGQLRVCEWDIFRSVYCGLCHTLGKRYGWLARNILNYDFVFLALLLTCVYPPCGTRRCRCTASPFRKKCVHNGTPALHYAADTGIILTYHKLADSVADSKGIKKLTAWLAKVLFSRKYRKARTRQPGFDLAARRHLGKLQELERGGCPSIDETADTFARMLSVCADEVSDDAIRRPLEQALYHTGRWIYIIDACDDLAGDSAKGRYNPVALRFDAVQITPELRETLYETLEQSLASVAAAYELMDFPVPEKQILQNIIYQGMPFVTSRVLDGTWNRRSKDERPL